MGGRTRAITPKNRKRMGRHPWTPAVRPSGSGTRSRRSRANSWVPTDVDTHHRALRERGVDRHHFPVPLAVRARSNGATAERKHLTLIVSVVAQLATCSRSLSFGRTGFIGDRIAEATAGQYFMSGPQYFFLGRKKTRGKKKKKKKKKK